MDNVNTQPPISKKESDKLIFESYIKLDNYWKKYRSPKYKSEFFSDIDYENISLLLLRVNLMIEYVRKYNLDVDTFNPIIPFDLRWKVPSVKVNYSSNTDDMTMLCDDVKSLTDDLEIAYENIRYNVKRTKMFRKDDYLNVLFDLYHLKLITDYGKESYGLTWDGIDLNFPPDLVSKVPDELKELTYEDYPL